MNLKKINVRGSIFLSISLLSFNFHEKLSGQKRTKERTNKQTMNCLFNKFRNTEDVKDLKKNKELCKKSLLKLCFMMKIKVNYRYALLQTALLFYLKISILHILVLSKQWTYNSYTSKKRRCMSYRNKKLEIIMITISSNLIFPLHLKK